MISIDHGLTVFESHISIHPSSFTSAWSASKCAVSPGPGLSSSAWCVLTATFWVVLYRTWGSTWRWLRGRPACGRVSKSTQKRVLDCCWRASGESARWRGKGTRKGKRNLFCCRATSPLPGREGRRWKLGLVGSSRPKQGAAARAPGRSAGQWALPSRRSLAALPSWSGQLGNPECSLQLGLIWAALLLGLGRAGNWASAGPPCSARWESGTRPWPRRLWLHVREEPTDSDLTGPGPGPCW